MVNHLIYGAIGFLLGGILGGALVGNIVAKDCRKQLDEMEERTKLLIDENEKLRNVNIEQREKKIAEEEEEVNDKYEEIRKTYDRAGVDNYTPKAVVDDIEDEEDDLIIDDDFILDEYDIPDIPEDEPSTIKLISEQMYNEELNYRDSESLTYYQVNGMLVDAANDIIFDEESIIGSEAMDIIDETKNDFLHVLDEKADKVYEIEIEHTMEYVRDAVGG